jgi:hypothetical protein
MCGFPTLQSIPIEQPTLRWNPLWCVEDEMKAFQLAKYFASSVRADGAGQAACSVSSTGSWFVGSESQLNTCVIGRCCSAAASSIPADRSRPAGSKSASCTAPSALAEHPLGVIVTSSEVFSRARLNGPAFAESCRSMIAGEPPRKPHNPTPPNTSERDWTRLLIA